MSPEAARARDAVAAGAHPGARARSCAAKASRSAPRRCSTRSTVLQRDRAGPRRRTSARRSPRRSPRARRTARVRAGVRPLLLPRRRARGAREQGIQRGGPGDASASSPSEELDALRAQIAAALRDGSEGAMRDLARMAIAAFARRQEGSGVIGVDVQRIRRALGLRAEPQPELPAGGPPSRRAAARGAAPLRGAAAPRARARADRAHRQPAAGAAARRAGPGAALGPARGPGGRPPRGGPAAPEAGHAGTAGAGPSPPRPRGRAAHDARIASDRRRAGGAQVPPAPPSPAGDLRAVRRLHQRHLGVGVLPVGAPRAPRHVPQDALVRVHRAHLRGHRHLRTRAQLQERSANGSATTPASRTSPATPTTGACGRSSWCRSRTICTRARP